MKDLFPESLGHKRGCALYMAKYGIWNTGAMELYIERYFHTQPDKYYSFWEAKPILRVFFFNKKDSSK